MAYQVTARKWRPMVFEDVIGQAHVANTLRNALAANRLAHAFIFAGGRGCGKTTTARILAKAVNCLHPKNFNPCNECEVCEEINVGRSLDIIEIDGASTNSVDDIRAIKEAVRYAPSRGGKRVYIIDEVHMLSKGAFNALLKTLEEPPEHIIFIFATTEIQKVPTTIISRCQRYDFRRISVDDIMARLKFIAGKESIAIDNDALLMIAKKGDGAMRDAQSIFDQAVSFCGTSITGAQLITVLNIVDQEFYFRVTAAIQERSAAAALQIVEEVMRNGYDLKEFAAGIVEHLRNVLIAKSTGSTSLIEASKIHRARYASTAEIFSEIDILRLIKLATDMETSLRYHSQPRFALEVAMVQMTKVATSVQIDQLLQHIYELKKNPIAVRPVAPPSPIAPSVSVGERKAQYASPEISNPFEARQPASRKIELPDSGKGGESGIGVPFEVTMEKVRTHWGTIVEDAKKGKIGVGTMLAESAPLDVLNGILRIACTDDFHYSTLKRNQQYLTQLCNTIMGTQLAVHPVCQKEGSPLPTAPPPPPEAPNSRPRTGTDKEHPLIEKLYRDFGAEKV